jgi:dephospho-CoA kinase
LLIIGLTGSIGMGKSTAAARFRENGIAVFDADAEVHRLYAGPIAAGFEKVDVKVVVSAGSDVQQQRVLSRPGMTAEKLETIIARQLSETEKRTRADFVVDTAGSIDNCHSQIDHIIAKLKGCAGTAYDRYWRD